MLVSVHYGYVSVNLIFVYGRIDCVIGKETIECFLADSIASTNANSFDFGIVDVT